MKKIPFAGIELTSQRVRGLRGTSELPGRPAPNTDKSCIQIIYLITYYVLHCFWIVLAVVCTINTTIMFLFVDFFLCHFMWYSSVCVCVCVLFPFILDIKFVGRTSTAGTFNMPTSYQ